MTPSRFLAGVLAAGLWAALIGTAPAHARVPVADSLATAVSGACSGGPGRVSLVVHPTSGGSDRVELSTRGLADGPRWRGQVSQLGDAEGRSKRFRRVAIEGGWTVSTRFPAPTNPDVTVFYVVETRERGDRGHRCVLLNLPSSPYAGSAECNSRRLDIVLLAHARDDGSTEVRSFIAGVTPYSRWHLTLTAIGAAGRQVVEFNDRAGQHRGAVRSRLVLTGVDDPRLRLVASNNDQGRCFIGLDPPNATSDASPELGQLGKLSVSRS